MTTQRTWNLEALCQRLHPATQEKHPLPVKDSEILLFTLTRYAEIHLTPPSYNWKWGMQRILPWPASLVPLFQALVTMIEMVKAKCWVGWRVILKKPLQIKARKCWNIFHIAATNVSMRLWVSPLAFKSQLSSRRLTLICDLIICNFVLRQKSK